MAYREVKIGKTVIPMKSNAATPWRFKQIFHQDLLKELNRLSNKINTEKAEKLNDDETNAGLDMSDIWIKVGFIMAMQASDIHYSKINEESFYKWLEQFENGEPSEAMEDIVDLWNGNAKTSTEPKKQDAEPSEK